MKKAGDPLPLCFSEVVGNAGLICSRVKKSAKAREGGNENQGVSGRWNADFCEVLEVIANKEVKGILDWAGEWCDAGRRTGSVAGATNALSQRFRKLSRNIIVEMVAVRTGC